jgi:hypothetical protein
MAQVIVHAVLLIQKPLGLKGAITQRTSLAIGVIRKRCSEREGNKNKSKTTTEENKCRIEMRNVSRAFPKEKGFKKFKTRKRSTVIKFSK